ncbi:MAG: hypothetical protein AAGD07_14890 [Planctomycetota bacterium]
MLVPEHWAEAKQTLFLEPESKSGQRTIKRYGWSDDSQQAAQRHAERRVAEAVERLKSGRDVLKREPRVAYNGGDGIPIREEIVERHCETIITRNSYGALCLNTPNIFFADIDTESHPGCVYYIATFGVSFVSLFALAHRFEIVGAFWLILFGSLILSALFGSSLHAIQNWFRGTPKQWALKRIERAAAARHDWSMRVYETPNGYRVLVTHRTFDPRSDLVREFSRDVAADPVYVRMCFNQNCFRARITPKPWRIGISSPVRPPGGVWPIRPDRLNERQQWVDQYDERRRNHAACRLVAQFGGMQACANAVDVQRVHDSHCQAEAGLPLA